MKRTCITRKIAAWGGVLIFSLAILFCPSASLPVQAAQSPGTVATPQKDDIQWRFKVENNKVYKRLYNYSTLVWIGDWIYVRDL